jgi:hypothetical protein
MPVLRLLRVILIGITILSGIAGTAAAQISSTIGLSSIPDDSDSICKEPFYTGSFYSTGYQKGDTVPDFKLYSLAGDSFHLVDYLSSGKPLLLVAGSLTCPVFRGKVPRINQVAAIYDSLISVIVIYTLEAHPTDTSVYFGYISTGAANIAAGITFPNPLNYAERKHLADTMDAWVSLNVPMFIDGPCNNWWKHFGPAPNNSYLIDTDGVVRSKHGWFDKSPDNIFCDLDSLLGFSSGLCNQSGNNGSFSINVINPASAGSPGDALYSFIDIINSSQQPCSILIRKLQQNLPATWQTSFCADICYSPNDDSIVITIPAQDTMHFSLDFITGLLPDSGKVKVGFRNVNNNSNAFSVWLSASTYPTALPGNDPASSRSLTLFPNPATSTLCLDFTAEYQSLGYRIADMTGRTVAGGTLTEGLNCIDVSALRPAMYLILLDSLPPAKGLFLRR